MLRNAIFSTLQDIFCPKLLKIQRESYHVYKFLICSAILRSFLVCVHEVLVERTKTGSLNGICCDLKIEQLFTVPTKACYNSFQMMAPIPGIFIKNSIYEEMIRRVAGRN